MQRLATTVMTSVKRVPIPKNGVDYRGKVVLAPMVRSGELPSRLLALHYGADLVWGKGLPLIIGVSLMEIQVQRRSTGQ
jgi:tRNA-dihydrouridine synthase 2